MNATNCITIGTAITWLAWSASVHALDSDPNEASEVTKDAAAGPGGSVATSVSNVSFEVAGKGGYLSPPIRGGTTPFGAGLGGRLGINLGGLYLGAGVVRYLGGTDIDVSDYALLYGGEVGWNLRLARVGSGGLFVRPHLGAGGTSIYRVEPSSASTSTTPTSRTRRQSNPVDVVTQASGSSSSSGSTTTSSGTASNTTVVNNVYADPGMTLMYTAGATFLGVTGHTLIVPGIRYGATEASTWLSYGVEGQLGLRF